MAFSALTAGSAQLTWLNAQELPVEIASEMVESALGQEIETPPAGRTTAARARGPAALAWLTIVLAGSILTAGYRRERARRAERVDPQPTDGLAPHHEEESRDRARGRFTRATPAKPRETLVLPDHVTEMLARAAARREAEAARAAARPSTEPEANHDDGLDCVVPGYDPWKGS